MKNKEKKIGNDEGGINDIWKIENMYIKEAETEQRMEANDT